MAPAPTRAARPRAPAASDGRPRRVHARRNPAARESSGSRAGLGRYLRPFPLPEPNGPPCDATRARRGPPVRDLPRQLPDAARTQSPDPKALPQPPRDVAAEAATRKDAPVFEPAKAPPSSKALDTQPEKGRFLSFDFSRDPLGAKKPMQTLAEIMKEETALKPGVMALQRKLLESRYGLTPKRDPQANSPAAPAVPARHAEPARGVQPADPRVKRSLRSVEDFTEFEQRAAYFNGDPIRADEEGVPGAAAERHPAHGAGAEHARLPAGAEAEPARPARPGQGDRHGEAGREAVLRQGEVRRLPPGPVLPRRQDARPAPGAVPRTSRATGRSRRSPCAASRRARRTCTTAGA